jgi:hypothetical protein
MKKRIGFLTMLFIALMVGVTMAEMDDNLFGVAYTPSTTNSQTKVIRGELRGVYIDTQSNNGTVTGKVTVASQGVTVFEKTAIIADAFYRPMLPAHDSAGAMANASTNQVYVFPPLCSAVTVTWLDLGSASNGTVNVRLIYNQ